MRIASGIDALVGHTPLVYLTNYSRAKGLESALVAKLEYCNPAAASRTAWPNPCWTVPSRKAS